MKKLNVLARLFGRAPNPAVSAIYQHAIGQPLLVHPTIGEKLIGGYLAGAVEAPGPVSVPGGATTQSAGQVAVLNVSGGLVARPTPGMCGPGPVSYIELREAFDAALSDGNVGAIVFRMDSPGGMASGCFDLCDHIHASRGAKPILAVVDDMAYSGCYAIAAACDQIWISRTGGVGSVGVVGYHVDQSGYDQKIGIKVTPIYAGGHKIDGNPHFPLSDDAKALAQGRIDALYGLFVESVAKYRSMDPEAVRSTEAACFYGQAALEAGMADKVGTFRDALASLSAEPPTPDAATVPDDESDEAAAAAIVDVLEGGTTTVLTDEQRAQLELGAVAAALREASLPSDLLAALLAPNVPVTAETVSARVEHARTVANLCTAAGLRDMAGDYASCNVPIETVRAQLQAVRVDTAPDIVTAIREASPSGAAPTGGGKRDEVFTQRSKAGPL